MLVFLLSPADLNIIRLGSELRDHQNEGVLCHLINSRMSELSITSGERRSPNPSASLALKNLRSLAKRCLMILIDRGGKRSFSLSRKIRALLFTVRTRAKASFSFT